MFKKIIIIPAILLTNFNVQAESVESKLKACAANSDSLMRLVCYDQLAKNMHGSDTIPAVKAKPNKNIIVQTPTPTGQKPVSKVDEFGGEQIRKKEAESTALKEITLTVASVKKDAYKRLTITFNNGQIWKQTESVVFRLIAGDTVKITRGMLNSFMLQKHGQNKSIRVKRVK